MKSDDYRKGYQAGFQAGFRAGKRSQKQLYDLTALVKWEHIDGDEETFHCPRCGENFYSENKQAPNFCWYCGAKSLDMKDLIALPRPFALPFIEKEGDRNDSGKRSSKR